MDQAKVKIVYGNGGRVGQEGSVRTELFKAVGCSGEVLAHFQ